MDDDQKNKLNKTTLPQVEEESDQEKVMWEKDMLGTFLSSHPLEKHLKVLANSSIETIYSALRHRPPKQVQILGILSDKKVIFTKSSGKPMAFITISDLMTRIDSVIFPDTYARLKNEIEENLPVIINGTLNERNGEKNIIIEDILSPKTAPKPKAMVIDIIDETNTDNIKEPQRGHYQKPRQDQN